MQASKILGSLVILCISISSAIADVPKWEASTGFPQLLRAGKYGYAMGELDGYWNLGYMKFGVGKVGFESYGVEAGLRTPIYKKLFGSLSAGWMSFTGAADVTGVAVDGASVANSVTVQLLGFYFMPSLGGRFPITDSIEYGFDIGLQIPVLAWGFIAADGNSSLITQGGGIQRLAYLPLPHITLIRISWK